MCKVRCAIIGAGWWGTTSHLPALKQHPDAELIAVQHKDGDIARKIARDHGIPHGYESWEELLSIDGLDAVVISSTPNLHYVQAKAALEKGISILIEKPMTFTAQQSRDLVEIASQQNVEIVVSIPFLYTRHVIECRRLIQSGELGPIRMVCVLMTEQMMGFYQGHDWKQIAEEHPDPEVQADIYIAPDQASYSNPEISGGGQIYAQTSHPATILPFLLDDEPIQVFAHFDCADTEVDVYNTINVKFQRGTTASLASTGNSGNSPRVLEMRVYGQSGMISMELFAGTMTYWDFDGEQQLYTDHSDEELYPRYAPANNLVDVVAGNSVNHAPGRLGLLAMEIIDAACKSSLSDTNISLR